MSYIKNSLLLAEQTLKTFIANEDNIHAIEKATNLMIATIQNDGRILSCGNGGSMCDSMHFVEELTGRYRKDRPPICAISMGDPSHITCVANDFGFEHIFSRYIEAWGKNGDTLLAISTSGQSTNIIKAVEVAKSKGMKTVGLLGKTGGALKDMVDVPLIVESNITDRIQEVHIKIIHMFIEGIERELFPENYR